MDNSDCRCCCGKVVASARFVVGLPEHRLLEDLFGIDAVVGFGFLVGFVAGLEMV